MGRDRSNEAKQQHFAKLVRATMETDAWRALPATAQALYPWLLLEWRGPMANNNGKIRLSVRQAAVRLGVGLNTASRAFHQLQAKGFIAVTEPARLGVEGAAQSPAYELTEIEMPHSGKNGGRRLFKEWVSGGDWPVIKAPANNRHGRRGKTESHHRFEDSTVTVLKTVQQKASSK